MADPYQSFDSLDAMNFSGAPMVRPAAAPTLGQYAQPSPVPVAGPPQNAEELNARASRWDTFFSRPDVLAAMLQFGVQAMQPVPAGQTNLGALGQSLAAGGEAAGRVQKIQREEAATKVSQEQAQQRIGTEKQRANIEQQRADIAGQQLDFEKDWRSKWLDIQRSQAGLESMRLQIANAANDIARERLTAEVKKSEADLKFKYDNLAAGWLEKNLERADKADVSLLSSMYGDVMRTPRLPGEPAPDINAIGKDFLTLRQTLQSVKKGQGNVFDLGTEQEWRAALSDPAARKRAEDTFGKDVVSRAEKEIEKLDKERTKTGGPR